MSNQWGVKKVLNGGRANEEEFLRIEKPDDDTQLDGFTVYIQAEVTGGLSDVVIAAVHWGNAKASFTRDFIVAFAPADPAGNPGPKVTPRPIRLPFAASHLGVSVRTETLAGGVASAGLVAKVTASVARGVTGEPRRASLHIPPSAALLPNGLVWPRPASLIRLEGFNTSADGFMMGIDKTGALANGDAPKICFPIFSGQPFSSDRAPDGTDFLQAIRWAYSSSGDVLTLVGGANVRVEAEIE